MPTLTNKQERFIREYLVDLNGAAAAIRAGYSEASARQIAADALSKPHVATALATRLHGLLKRTEVTEERVVSEIARLAFSNIGDYLQTDENGTRFIDVANLPREVAGCISEVTFESTTTGEGPDAKTVTRTKLKLYDKQKALDSLMRYLQLYVQKIEHTGRDGGAIEVVETPALELARRYAFLLERIAREQKSIVHRADEFNDTDERVN